MAKIPFDIKFRPQIESGEYKVETREGLPVRIICWDRLAKKHNDDDLNLCVLVPDDEGEAVYYYHRSGKKWVPNDDYDLFIITPELELSEFEKKVADIIDLWHEDYEQWTEPGASAHNYPYQIKTDAAELLALAREQFIKEKQKPAEWSKEDKHRLEQAINALSRNGYYVLVDWLQFLPERFNPQPKEERETMEIKHSKGKLITKTEKLEE